MSHNPNLVPTFEEALKKLWGGSRHGRTDYCRMISTADGKVILDGVESLRTKLAEAERRLEVAVEQFEDIDRITAFTGSQSIKEIARVAEKALNTLRGDK